MNDLEKQLNKISKKIEQDSKMNLSVNELFSLEFMKQNNIHKTIQEIFTEANVDIAHIKNLTLEEKRNLSAVLPHNKFKDWDDFFNSAGQYQIVKELKKKGYSFK